MALADISYEFEQYPIRLAAAVGHISGDQYPYNDEINKNYKGFVPMRSQYKGLMVENVLILDRLVIPRPMNLSYLNLYAFNHLKNLSDMQYLGFGFTWYPFENRKTLSVTSDTIFFWKAVDIPQWDKNGTHPDPLAEQELQFDRQQLEFSGWESTEKARRFLGIETDIKILYKILDHCNSVFRFCAFFPGGLYRDLDGQPNIATRRLDQTGQSHYDSLGREIALGFVCGIDYRF
jgi:hypothetical protein